MPLPKLCLYNRQKVQVVPLPWLRRIGKAALPGCLAALKSPNAPLASLQEIEVTLVNDADMARVHGDFLDDPTPTDVITFHHGEILISVETAMRQGLEHGQSLDHEVALYLIHGLLHLAGWDDHTADEASEMAERQGRILQDVLLG